MGHQDTDRIPCVCADSVARGRDVLDLKSHSLITGFLSSPDAVTKFRPWSGFQAISVKLPPNGSFNSHQAFLPFKSHTMHEPFCAQEANICAT